MLRLGHLAAEVSVISKLAKKREERSSSIAFGNKDLTDMTSYSVIKMSERP